MYYKCSSLINIFIEVWETPFDKQDIIDHEKTCGEGKFQVGYNLSL